MLRVELGKAARRWRTWALAVVLGAVPALFVAALRFSPPSGGGGDGPPFLVQTLSNGLFAPLVALVLIQPFLLPLAAALLSGDAVAGEAAGGTLRYLLVRPVGRARLVLVKYAAVLLLLAALLGVVVVVGLAAGAAAFGLRPLPTLSGTILPIGEGLVRIAAATAYVLGGVAGLAAVGMFVSTLTESGPGATVATVAVAIVMQIVGALDSLRAVHPWLLTQPWRSLAELLRSPISTEPLVRGVLVYGAYTAVFLALAVTVLRRRDIAS